MDNWRLCFYISPAASILIHIDPLLTSPLQLHGKIRLESFLFHRKVYHTKPYPAATT